MYLLVLNGLFLTRFVAGGRISAIRAAYWPVLLGLFAFAAFRFEVGCDWSGYYNQFLIFGSTPLAGLIDQAEPLWTGIIALQGRLGLDYPWLNVAAAAIFFVGVHRMARRQPNPLAFVVLLFPVLIINMPMSGIRQGAAIGVMCIAFNAFSDGRLFRFLAAVVVATALHSSAIVFLLLAPLVTGRYSRSRLLLAGLLAIPGALVLAGTGSAAEASSRYIDSGIDAAGALFRVGVCAVSGMYFLTFLRRPWRTHSPQDYKIAMLGALMMAGAMLLIPVSSVIADRIVYYLVPIQAMIFARIPLLPIRLNRRLHVLLPYLLLGAMFVVWTSLSWHFDKCYRPYKTWIFGYPEAVKLAL